MWKIPYKALAIYGKLPSMGVYTKYLPVGAFDLYGLYGSTSDPNTMLSFSLLSMTEKLQLTCMLWQSTPKG